MSFSYRFKTLRSRKSYDLTTQLEMSTHEDKNSGEAETGIVEGGEENSIRLVGERIKASLEPLHAQICAFSEMMNQLILSNSTKESTTVSSRGFGHQYESPYCERPGSSKFPAVAPLTTAGYSSDKEILR